MTGPQKHTVQTPNLRRYDWMSRVCFKPLSSGWLTVSFCWTHNLGAGGVIVAQKSRFRAGNCFISSWWSWLHPGRAHTESTILDLLKLPFFTILEQMFLTFSQQALWLSQIQETCGRVVETCCPFFLHSALTFVFYVHPYSGKMNPFWRAYFSDWLVKNHQPVFYLFDFKEFVSLDLSPIFFWGGGHCRLKPWSCRVLPEVSAIGIDVGSHSEVWLFSWPSTKVATAEWPWWCLFSLMKVYGGIPKPKIVTILVDTVCLHFCFKWV